MDKIIYLLNTILTLTTAWIVRKFLNALFPKRLFNNKIFVYFLWISLILMQLFAEFTKGTGSLLLLLLQISLVFLISIIGYEGLIRQKLFCIIMINVVWMFMEIVAAIMLSLLKMEAVQFDMAGSIISKFIMIIFVVLFNIKMWKSKFGSVSFKNAISLIFVPVSSIYIGYNLFLTVCQRVNMAFINVISFMLLFAINIIVYELYFKLSENNMIEKENAVYEQQIEYLPKYIEERSASNTAFRSMKHDLKNRMIGLKLMLKQNNTEDSIKIINEMIQTCSNNLNDISTSGNEVVDVIMYYKQIVAQELGIEIHKKIFIPQETQEMDILNTDLSVILGNLLDNAIEATRQCNNKYIDFSMGIRNQALIIVIKNPYLKIVKDKEGNFITTKEDKTNHGFGLSSVKKIIEKYNGELVVDLDENEFVMTVIMEFGQP